MIDMPVSTSWLATMHGRNRAFGRLESRDEWDYFHQNVAKFQCRPGQSGEADNFSGISFGAFANDWNRWVAALGSRKPRVTYKTAAQLKDAFKASAKKAIENATIGPHQREIDNLQRELRDRATNVKHLPDFAEATAATLAQPCLKQVQESGSQTTHLGPIGLEAGTVAGPPATENIDAEHSAAAATPSGVAVEAPAGVSAPAEMQAKARTTREPRRCRTCGLVSKDWRE